MQLSDRWYRIQRVCGLKALQMIEVYCSNSARLKKTWDLSSDVAVLLPSHFARSSVCSVLVSRLVSLSKLLIPSTPEGPLLTK